MTSEQFIELKNALGEKGYRFTKSVFTSEDHAFYKPFGKYSNPYDEERSCYQIFFRVWDFTQFPQAKDRPYGVDVRIAVSRVIDERIDLEIPYEGQPISYFENKDEEHWLYGTATCKDIWCLHQLQNLVRIITKQELKVNLWN